MTEEIKGWTSADWRDRESYPSNPEDLEDWEWRWQFLRRLPLYRDLWERLPRSPAFDPDLEFDPDDSWRGIGRAGLSETQQFAAWYLTNLQVMWNPTLEHIAEQDPFTRDKGGSVIEMPSRAYWEDMESYGENLEGTERLEIIERKFQFLVRSLWSMGILEDSKGPYIYARFDVMRPLQKQIKNVERQLKIVVGNRGRSPRLGVKSRELWPLYLRVIDAKDQCAPDMDIFNHLLNEADKNKDLDLYERLEKVEQEAVLIADWTSAAHRLMENASHYL